LTGQFSVESESQDHSYGKDIWFKGTSQGNQDLPQQWLTGAFYVGLLDGLLGVAGIMTLLVMTGIIPENCLRKTHQ